MSKIKKIFYSPKIAPYVFVLPFILTFLLFFFTPILNTIIMSFQSILPGQTEFIGLKNFQKLFADKTFWKAVGTSFKYMVCTLALLIPIPMFLACLINNKLTLGKEIFKSTLFIPALTSVVVAGTIFRLMFGELPGSLMNQLLAVVGIDPIKWLKLPVTGFLTLLILACWRWMGVNMLYFLSGLKNIPGELYESADIDGAGWWKKFTAITVPMLKPTIVYVLTISIYGGLAMFTESYMLWNGNVSPQNIGLTIVGYLYRQGIEKNQLGYASAVGLVLLIITMTFNMVQLWLTGTFKKED